MSSLRRARVTPARLATLALAVGSLTLALAAATANASLLSPVKTFGSFGSGAGQFNGAIAVAIQPTSGNVYVTDPGNRRVDEFGPGGNFIAAFGWGVADGKAQAEVCTTSCQAGIANPGPGELGFPTSIAVGVPGGPSAGKVFVGDATNNVVFEFDADGNFIKTIDGTSTPQGHFGSLNGVATDQAGNLWTVDGSNVDEFNAKGAFVQQWNDKNGPSTIAPIAVDSTNGAVYIRDTFGGEPSVNRYTLTGTWKSEITRVVSTHTAFTPPSALALDPHTGNLYVDHDNSSVSDVTVFDHNGVQLDDVSLSSDGSQGLAFASLRGGSGKPGQGDLYVVDGANDNVTIFAPPTTPGLPLVTSESVNQNGKATATLGAAIVPVGSDTTCKFQFVSNADFLTSGFANATSVPCSPSDLGSGFAYQAATVDLSGLATGSYYHFRVVASSSAGTTTGASKEFQAGPGLWAPFNRCPVDDPAMLSTDGVNQLAFCVASNSTHGSITLGNITTATGNTSLQAGAIESNNTFSIVPLAGGSLVVDPVQISSPVGTVTALTESAGTPSNFCPFCAASLGNPIITIPIKIHLENPTLGPNCYIGSNQNPILLNPQNNDASNGTFDFSPFDANGAPDPSGPLTAIEFNGLVQGDDTFSVPGATGCGQNDSLDGAVDAVAGVPSPSGSNHLVLDDATADIAGAIGASGQQFANDWHVAFG